MDAIEQNYSAGFREKSLKEKYEQFLAELSTNPDEKIWTPIEQLQ